MTIQTTTKILKRSNDYARRAQDMSPGQRQILPRYLNFKYARDLLDKYIASVGEELDPEKLALLKRRGIDLERRMNAEEARARYYEINFDNLLPDKIRTLKRTVYALAATIGLGVVAGVGYLGYRTWGALDNLRTAENFFIPNVNEAIEREDISSAERDYFQLDEIRCDLPRREFRELWRKVDSLKDNLDNLKKLVSAREKFGEAKRFTDKNNFAGALALFGGRNGIEVLLGGIDKNKLPDSKQKEFDILVEKVSELREVCGTYDSDANKFTPAKNYASVVITEIKSFEAQVTKGELFDLTKTDTILHKINDYLSDLATVRASAVGGSEAIENVRNKLLEIREAVDGKDGLLTKYELVEFDKVKKILEGVNESISSLDSTQYVEDGLSGEVDKIRKVLNKFKLELRQVDHTRVDTFEVFSALGNLESRLNLANEKVDYVVRLKEGIKSEDEKIRLSAALELTKRYFERDYKNKKWDRVSEMLRLIPEPRPETVEHIDEIVKNEEKLMKQEGKILVTAQGLTESDLVGYKITIDNFKDKKITKDIEWGVQNLLKRADLEEGKTVLDLIKELNMLRLNLGIAEGNEKAREISEKITEMEGKILEGLNKFGSDAKALLEKGDSIENPKLLEIVAMHYGQVGKNDVAKEYENKKDELKKKYGLE